MNKLLSQEEREALKKVHREVKEKRFSVRILCILALDDGYTYEEIKQLFLLDDATINNYKKRYEEGKIEKLLELNYKGYEGKLTCEQEEELKKYLREHLSRTAKEVVVYVRENFGVKYTSEGMVHLLHRLGFVYKKTKLVPAKADISLQQEFIKEYKELREGLNEEDTIYFMDAVHVVHNGEVCYGWIEKGKEKNTLTNTGRERININGVLNIETHQVIEREDKSINSVSAIELLKAVEERHKESKNIYVICDNAKYYRSNLVREYLKSSKIRFIFLPPYSPNLNLIERLWKFFKEKVIKGKYYEKLDIFREAVHNFFNNLSQYQDELKSLLTEKFYIVSTAPT